MTSTPIHYQSRGLGHPLEDVRSLVELIRQNADDSLFSHDSSGPRGYENSSSSMIDDMILSNSRQREEPELRGKSRFRGDRGITRRNSINARADGKSINTNGGGFLTNGRKSGRILHSSPVKRIGNRQNMKRKYEDYKDEKQLCMNARKSDNHPKSTRVSTTNQKSYSTRSDDYGDDYINSAGFGTKNQQNGDYQKDDSRMHDYHADPHFLGIFDDENKENIIENFLSGSSMSNSNRMEEARYSSRNIRSCAMGPLPDSRATMGAPQSRLTGVPDSRGTMGVPDSRLTGVPDSRATMGAPQNRLTGVPEKIGPRNTINFEQGFGKVTTGDMRKSGRITMQDMMSGNQIPVSQQTVITESESKMGADVNYIPTGNKLRDANGKNWSPSVIKERFDGRLETSLLTQTVGNHWSRGFYGDMVDWAKPYYIVDDQRISPNSQNSLTNSSENHNSITESSSQNATENSSDHTTTENSSTTGKDTTTTENDSSASERKKTRSKRDRTGKKEQRKQKKKDQVLQHVLQQSALLQQQQMILQQQQAQQAASMVSINGAVPSTTTATNLPMSVLPMSTPGTNLQPFIVATDQDLAMQTAENTNINANLATNVSGEKADASAGSEVIQNQNPSCDVDEVISKEVFGDDHKRSKDRRDKRDKRVRIEKSRKLLKREDFVSSSSEEDDGNDRKPTLFEGVRDLLFDSESEGDIPDNRENSDRRNRDQWDHEDDRREIVETRSLLRRDRNADRRENPSRRKRSRDRSVAENDRRANKNHSTERRANRRGSDSDREQTRDRSGDRKHGRRDTDRKERRSDNDRKERWKHISSRGDEVGSRRADKVDSRQRTGHDRDEDDSRGRDRVENKSRDDRRRNFKNKRQVSFEDEHRRSDDRDRDRSDDRNRSMNSDSSKEHSSSSRTKKYSSSSRGRSKENSSSSRGRSKENSSSSRGRSRGQDSSSSRGRNQDRRKRSKEDRVEDLRNDDQGRNEDRRKRSKENRNGDDRNRSGDYRKRGKASRDRRKRSE